MQIDLNDSYQSSQINKKLVNIYFPIFNGPDVVIKEKKHIGSLLKKEPDFKFQNFDTSNISKIASQKWHSESEEIKLKFERFANAAKIKHQQLYSDYKYKPKNKACRLRKLNKKLPYESIINILSNLNKPVSPLAEEAESSILVEEVVSLNRAKEENLAEEMGSLNLVEEDLNITSSQLPP
ncbi:23657_t:CDS:2 [Gigaspora margarita]|uniref:23657_t:CDS:1 n=1 Tax=Gigaspora margarita TaxID=4874 RepID=A0ABN7VAG2_GIGMA|nr:23657_t:CDS:2 [Gigaspora margarita]